jgi:hypothetical protein
MLIRPHIGKEFLYSGGPTFEWLFIDVQCGTRPVERNSH